MRRRLLLLLLVAGALVVPATSASPQSAPGGSGLGIRLAEAPASARDDPRARTSVIDAVEAGTSFTRRVQVRNDTAEPIDARAYVAAATIEDGSFVIGSDEDDNELRGWATMEPAELRLAPGEVRDVSLTVAVPQDAPDGEYYGAAVAAVRSDDAGEVVLENRVAVRIFLAVGDEPPVTDFEITRLTAGRTERGAPLVTASVTNTGERALDMSGELELAGGPGGIRAGPFEAELGRTLAIGETQPVRVVLDRETPAGPWEAELTLRSGRVEKAVAGTIRFPEPGDRPTDITFEEVEEGKSQAALAAGLLLLLVLLGLLFWLWKRRRDRREDPQAARNAQVRS